MSRVHVFTLSCLVWVSACGGDTEPGDTTDARDTTDSADTRPDASEVIDDGSLDGTFLAQTQVGWDEPVTLCSMWREGADIEQELAHKVMVTLSPGQRQGLSRGELAAATIVSVDLQTSPFAAGKHRPVASSSVSTWQVLRYDSYDVLLATVSHGFDGVGVLEERYSVARDGTSNPAVEFEEDSGLTFWWWPEGAAEAHILGLCSPPASWEQAVETVVVEKGGEHSTLLRYYRTPYSEITAGSYPVHLEATTVYLGSPTPWPVTASGFWAHTYVAKHHNWADDTIIDFARDLGGWQTLFGPLSRGENPRFESISKIEYLDVRGDAPGDVAISRIDSTGTTNRSVWQVVAGPVRVDGNAVKREFGHRCAEPTVGVVGFSDHLAQLVFCPSSGPAGKELVGVVPVVWTVDPAMAGKRFDGDDIDALSGRLGWTVEVGTSRVVIEAQADDYFLVEVFDKDGQSMAQLWTALGVLEPDTGWQAPVSATSTDGNVELAIEREWVAQGVGHSAIYGCPRVSLRWGDRHDVVDAWDTIDYVNTHHNWEDSLEATTADGVVLHWKLSFDIFGGNGFTHEVWVTDTSGAELLPKTIVVPPAED